jgi:hypothetical protein
MISNSMTLQMLRSLGGEVIRHDAGEFVGIFEMPFDLVGDDVGVEQQQPTLTARSIDVDAIQKNTILHRGMDVYRVSRREPDGTGVTRLVLKKA